jgi:hypothetical protein
VEVGTAWQSVEAVDDAVLEICDVPGIYSQSRWRVVVFGRSLANWVRV